MAGEMGEHHLWESIVVSSEDKLETSDKMKTGVNEAEKSDMRVDDTRKKDNSDLKNEDDFPTLTEVNSSEVVQACLGYEDVLCEVNIDADINTDDVERAGGFGATDDIGSLLPVAMDSTDFEASLRDARDFEGPQEKLSRPGLGWTGPTEPDANLLASRR